MAATPLNRAAWFGEQQLTRHDPHAPIDVGSVVWEKSPEQLHAEREGLDTPADSINSERRGGIVVRTFGDDNDELMVTILEGRKRQGRFEVYTWTVPAGDVDRQLIESPSQRRMHQAARQICRALGERPAAYLSGIDRYLLEVCVGLVVAAETMGERGAA